MPNARQRSITNEEPSSGRVQQASGQRLPMLCSTWYPRWHLVPPDSLMVRRDRHSLQRRAGAWASAFSAKSAEEGFDLRAYLELLKQRGFESPNETDAGPVRRWLARSKMRLKEMPVTDTMDVHDGTGRRIHAIAIAGDDDAVGADALAAARAAISNLSVAELQDLANAHILFADHAPPEIMVNFLLRQRLAAELLEKMSAGSKPYPLQPETVEIGRTERASALGTLQPPAPYRPGKSRRSKVPTKPPTSSPK